MLTFSVNKEKEQRFYTALNNVLIGRDLHTIPKTELELVSNYILQKTDSMSNISVKEKKHFTFLRPSFNIDHKFISKQEKTIPVDLFYDEKLIGACEPSFEDDLIDDIDAENIDLLEWLKGYELGFMAEYNFSIIELMGILLFSCESTQVKSNRTRSRKFKLFQEDITKDVEKSYLIERVLMDDVCIDYIKNNYRAGDLI